MRLSRSKFLAWLKAKKPGEIVGRHRDCHRCPIAQFYLEATGGHEVVISENGNGYRIDRGYGDRRAPWWAEDFMSRVDADWNGKITARRAIEILMA